MGVSLTPIILKRVVDLNALAGLTLAVDAFNVLHQFLALIRAPDGASLTDDEGRVTSHLVGLAFRTTRLAADYQIRPVFIFDGRPPRLKRKEVEKRRALRERAEEEYAAALERGDYAEAFSKAVMTGRLTSDLIADSKRLLDLLGIPWVQAPGEGEAQAAYMAVRGDVWAVNSRDYDSIIFGAPRLVRYLTIQGREYLPSKGMSRRLEPEIIDLKAFRDHHGITQGQLIDLAIMIGTDFNEGIKGVGPKTALRLVKKHGRLEDMPEVVAKKLPDNYNEIRRLYLEPEVTDEYTIEWRPPLEDQLYAFLVEERSFSRRRVGTVVGRMRRFHGQKKLGTWLMGAH